MPQWHSKVILTFELKWILPWFRTIKLWTLANNDVTGRKHDHQLCQHFVQGVNEPLHLRATPISVTQWTCSSGPNGLAFSRNHETQYNPQNLVKGNKQPEWYVTLATRGDNTDEREPGICLIMTHLSQRTKWSRRCATVVVTLSRFIYYVYRLGLMKPWLELCGVLEVWTEPRARGFIQL